MDEMEAYLLCLLNWQTTSCKIKKNPNDDLNLLDSLSTGIAFPFCTLQTQMYKCSRHTNGHTHLDVSSRTWRRAVTELQVCGAPQGLWYCSNTKTDGKGCEEGSALSRCAHRALTTTFPIYLPSETEKLCFCRVLAIKAHLHVKVPSFGNSQEPFRECLYLMVLMYDCKKDKINHWRKSH